MVARNIRVGMLVYGLDRPASGIGRYVIELLHALVANQPDVEIALLQPFARSIVGLDANVPIVGLRGCRLLPGMMAFGPVAIAAAARRHRFDVVHDPIGISPFLPRRLGSFARVVTLHDAIPFVHPETHPRLTNALFHHYIPHTLPFADRIVTVSDAATGDIMRFYQVAPERIVRIHIAAGSQFRPVTPHEVTPVLARYGIDRPYILTVGALQARKNLESVFSAYARLREAGVPQRLVIVGSKAWKTEGAFRRLDELDLDDTVVLTGYVPDADLPALYAGADCFVFPSLYEGFGLPPLEAMACGTPVVASDRSSLPEVIGDAGILVAPTDVAALASAVHRIISDPGLAADLRSKGIRRARRFSWEQTAAQHAALYRDLASTRHVGGPNDEPAVPLRHRQ